jgi:hypothetical protein
LSLKQTLGVVEVSSDLSGTVGGHYDVFEWDRDYKDSNKDWIILSDGNSRRRWSIENALIFNFLERRLPKSFKEEYQEPRDVFCLCRGVAQLLTRQLARRRQYTAME